MRPPRMEVARYGCQTALALAARRRRRLICFEDKRDAESFIEAVQEWEQFKEARKADVVPEHPLQMEELAVRRGCKLLVLHQGEIKVRIE